MRSIQRAGGVAALYLAFVNLVGMATFLVILDYPSKTTAADRLQLLVEHQGIVFFTNVALYVSFGLVLLVLLLALHDRLLTHARTLARLVVVVGVIWAGSLIASGMVANAGAERVIDLYAVNPTQAGLSWQVIESVTDGLGNGNGEILGGVLTVLVSLAAWRTGRLPKALNILGLVAGTAGILSLLPPLTATLVGVFGLTQVIWLIGLGFVLLSESTAVLALDHPATTVSVHFGDQSA